MAESNLFTIAFFQKIMLILVGAILTGIGVPLVKAVIDWYSAKRQKRLESELARQKEIIDSQIKLLSEFSELCWRMVFDAYKVSYAFAWEDEKQQAKRYDDYGPISWEILFKIRSTISAGARLINRKTQQELLRVYNWLIEYDEKICDMAEDDIIKKDRKEWAAFHNAKYAEAGKNIDSAISMLANDLLLFARGDKVKG